MNNHLLFHIINCLLIILLLIQSILYLFIFHNRYVYSIHFHLFLYNYNNIIIKYYQQVIHDYIYLKIIICLLLFNIVIQYNIIIYFPISDLFIICYVFYKLNLYIIKINYT